MEATATKATVQKYPAYKDSGEIWLKNIPAHWEMRKGKFLFKKEERPVRDEDDIVTCFRDGQVTLRTNRRTEGFTNALKEHGYQGIRKGDLVIHAMDAFAGAIGVSDSDGKSTPVYSVCTPRIEGKVNQYYYAYFLRNMANSNIILSLAKGIRERSTDFRFKDFGELNIVFPSIEEQTAIAAFLDDKTAKIDRAIAQKEKMIALLKERKQIIIQNAVTKGLNPNVKMKHSGVEWIGEIPEKWEVKRLKSICKTYGRIGFRGYSTSDLVGENEGAITISPSNIQGDFMYFEKCTYLSWAKYHESPEIKIFKNDVLIVKTGSTYGKVGIASNLETEATINPQLLVFKDVLIDNEYFYEILNTSQIQIQINREVIGSTIPTISEYKILNMKVGCPADEERPEIMNYVKDVEFKFNHAIGLQEQQIEKLKELKATLIDGAVTGKIKVR